MGHKRELAFVYLFVYVCLFVSLFVSRAKRIQITMEHNIAYSEESPVRLNTFPEFFVTPRVQKKMT